MRDYIALFLISIAYLVVQSTLVTSLPMPDVLLLIVFYAAARRPSTLAVIFSFFLGYMEDIFLGGVLGSTSFSFMAIFVAVYFLTRKVQFKTPGVIAITALALSAIKAFLVFAIMKTINSEITPSFFTMTEILLTAVFAPLVMNLLERLETIVSPHAFER